MTKFLTIALLWATPAATASDLLWYRQSAANWNEALPIGNGRLGGMVFGDVISEHIQLNEDTVWAGEKRDRNNPEAAKNLPEVRRLLFAGMPHEAEVLADKTIISIPRRLPPYQTMGDLRINSNLQTVTDYRRELDLDTAVVRVTYRGQGRRELHARIFFFRAGPGDRHPPHLRQASSHRYRDDLAKLANLALIDAKCAYPGPIESCSKVKPSRAMPVTIRSAPSA